MRLEVIQTEEELRALEPYWDRLLEVSATPTPFLRWDWVNLWWKEHRDQFTLAVGVVRNEAGEPDGIAPLVIGREAEGPRRHLRQLGFINGLGPLQGERLDFLVRKGREAVLTPILIGIFKLFEKQWDVMRLNKVPEESPNYPYLQKAMAACGRDSGVLNRTECVFIRLPRSWEEYEQSQSGHWRRKMRKRWQVLTEEYEASLKLAGRDLPAAATFDEFAKLHALKWPEGVSSFLRPASMRLHRQLAELWIPQGLAFLPVIEHEGRRIAGIYNLACGGEILQYQLGWSPEYARLGLGNLAMRWSIACAIEAGFQTYDLLPGAHGYKHDWSDHVRFVSDLECFHHQKPRALLFQVMRAIKRRVSAALAHT